MDKKRADQNRIILAVFAVFSLILFIVIVALTTGGEMSTGDLPVYFGDGWSDSSGNVSDISDIRVDDMGVSPIMGKKLPDTLSDGDCLCFESYNLNVRVMVDGEEIYSFVSEDNITGKGYGTMNHEVGLGSAQAGKTVQVLFESCNHAIPSKRAYIGNVYLGAPVPYVYMVIRGNILPLIASGLIFFFGIVFLLISFVISDNERLPFDVGALGLSSIIIGAWLLILTNAFQLISGHIYLIRSLNRFLVLMCGVPLICFFNSLTKKKRRIYPLIELITCVLSIILITVLRYFFDIDMMHSFQRVLIVYILILIIVTVTMLTENELYCRSIGTHTGLKYYYFGISVFVVSALIDYAMYYQRKLFGNTYGAITSFGTFILIPMVMIRFIRWWTKDRQVVERERFTNRALQYALSSDSPDESIRLMLKYMGEEFKCKRVIVFEDVHNGKFNGKYAWFDNNLEKRSVDLLYVPYKGIVDEVLNSYKAGGNRYIINDPDNIKDVNNSLYNILMEYDVKTLVANPLEVDGVVTGILLFLDIPADLTEEASSVATLTSYFLSQLILRRDDQKRRWTYTYNDSLSGAQNRRAFDKFVSEKLDLASPFGFLICGIDGLEDISDRKGFETGDSIVADVVRFMSDVFGSRNVYRLAGSRLAAFGFETDETYFNDDIARFEKNAKDVGISISVGSVYCMNGAKDMNTVVKRARDTMTKA